MRIDSIILSVMLTSEFWTVLLTYPHNLKNSKGFKILTKHHNVVCEIQIIYNLTLKREAPTDEEVEIGNLRYESIENIP